MTEKFRLQAEELNKKYNLDEFTFETTAELQQHRGMIGQPRADNALNFGFKIKEKGYNIYVAGPSGTGKSSFTSSMAREFAKKEPVASDWIYVYNFKKEESPRAISLLAGSGKRFKKEIEDTIEDLRKLIPETFKGLEYESRKSELIRITNQKRTKILKDLNKKSAEYGFMYSPTEQGLVSMALKEGRPMSEEDFQNLSVDEREDMTTRYDELTLKTLDNFNSLREADEELAQGIKDLDKKIVGDLVGFDIDRLIERYKRNDHLVKHLNELEEDILENLDKFKAAPVRDFPFLGLPDEKNDSFFVRYKVNLFIDNGNLEHAPVINESNPIYYNLMGSIEYKSQMGILATDFTCIKPGSLHLANGGYLIFQMKEILSNPISWEMLKRALKTDEINIENQNKLMGYAITSSLKPEPIPLDIKVIIIGDENTYDMLYAYEDDFKKLFKVKADFDIEMDKNKANIDLMSEFIATHCQMTKTRHLDKSAVARILEYASRLAEHQDKMSTEFNDIVEILYEANFWADLDSIDIISEKYIEKAIDEKVYRSNKYEEKLNEMFQEETILIDLDGEKIGQINGLAVLGTSDYAFGKPSRITASVYSGEEGIISIERESEQSGNTYNKGVLTLSGYLGQNYAGEKPLGISISIAFEQNYSVIDGDSASSTELYAILSSMAKLPIKQYIAVTGSVNQRGEIQPIGGVNEKIEGFYEVCKRKGFTGLQGVMIPRKNVKNLVLKDKLVESVRLGEFHIYAIDHIEEGIEILTGYRLKDLNKLIMENLEAMQVDPSGD